MSLMARYYCPNCDQEWEEEELDEGKCHECGGEVEEVEEEVADTEGLSNEESDWEEGSEGGDKDIKWEPETEE